MQTLGDVITVALAIVAILVVPYKIAKAWLWPSIKPVVTALFTGPSVNDNDEIMSRLPISDASSSAAAVRQTPLQTPDRRTIPVPTPTEMLDIFKVLRAAGVNREALRGPWRAAGLPLDNNLWTAAAPPEDTHTTPIAGRRTSAQFEQDPELRYEAPPR